MEPEKGTHMDTKIESKQIETVETALPPVSDEALLRAAGRDMISPTTVPPCIPTVQSCGH